MTKIAPVVPRKVMPEGFEGAIIDRVVAAEAVRERVFVSDDFQVTVTPHGNSAHTIALDASNSEQLVHALAQVLERMPQSAQYPDDSPYSFEMEVKWSGQTWSYHIHGIPTDEALTGVLSLVHRWLDGTLEPPVTVRSKPH